MDHLTQQGEEIVFRLGYDDINESLAHPAIVKRTLQWLGSSDSAIASGDSQPAYDTLLTLGYPRPSEGDDQAPSPPVRSYDAERSAVFWSCRVFVKTFYERRSWLAAFRAFYRIFCLQAMITHILIAAAFTKGAWSDRSALNALSSVVITHACCAFLDRLSNAWMSLRQINPLEEQKRSKRWMEGKQRGQEEGDESPMALARKRRRIIAMEGAWFLGAGGAIERLLVLVCLSCLFVTQFMELGRISLLAHQYWYPVAGGYAAMLLVYGGQNQPLSHPSWLIPLFSSCRGCHDQGRLCGSSLGGDFEAPSSSVLDQWQPLHWMVGLGSDCSLLEHCPFTQSCV